MLVSSPAWGSPTPALSLRNSRPRRQRPIRMLHTCSHLPVGLAVTAPPSMSTVLTGYGLTCPASLISLAAPALFSPTWRCASPASALARGLPLRRPWEALTRLRASGTPLPSWCRREKSGERLHLFLSKPCASIRRSGGERSLALHSSPRQTTQRGCPSPSL